MSSLERLNSITGIYRGGETERRSEQWLRAGTEGRPVHRITGQITDVLDLAGEGSLTIYDFAGTAHVHNTFRLTAFGSGTVYAYDNAVIDVHGDITVIAIGNARVTLYDRCRAVIDESALGVFYGASTGTILGTGQAEFYDQTHGSAHNMAKRVFVRDQATVVAHDGAALWVFDQAVARGRGSATITVMPSDRFLGNQKPMGWLQVIDVSDFCRVRVPEMMRQGGGPGQLRGFLSAPTTPIEYFTDPELPVPDFVARAGSSSFHDQAPGTGAPADGGDVPVTAAVDHPGLPEVQEAVAVINPAPPAAPPAQAPAAPPAAPEPFAVPAFGGSNAPVPGALIGSAASDYKPAAPAPLPATPVAPAGGGYTSATVPVSGEPINQRDALAAQGINVDELPEATPLVASGNGSVFGADWSTFSSSQSGAGTLDDPAAGAR